ncbi:unnamed protein product [Triticum turgidum subsp. durum]|uniref:DUF1618 domain-containing protein n=1 Tax=Triticum turgidum subsp. durum TaxID=4567 RepID=A0A9R0SH45_TRITD|nr:unnamed protein product [Triticum turgidum subsp. durum]
MGMDDHEFRLLTIPPPIHPEDPDSPLPETILIDSFGYLSDRTNATTANGRRSRTKKKGKRILVTFWPAAPPRVSCFTVHCPDLKPDAYGSIPKVCYTEDGLALLCITICPERQYMYPKNICYFVYQAGTKNTPPSVKLVHSPPDFTFFDHEVALLRRRDQDMFFIAVLRRAFVEREFTDGHFNLHLYSSKTKTWSTKLMHLDSPPDFEFHSLNKGITIGGEHGSVGWVDLRRGIIICDLLLLDSNQSLRYVPLPSPLSPEPLQRYPLSVRNIVVLQGYIKYFEMHNNVRPSSYTGSSPILEGYPALSLHDGDVVYLMHTPDPHEGKACVIALDMRNKTVKGVANFGSGRPLRYHFTYLESGISKHLGILLPTRMVNIVSAFILLAFTFPSKISALAAPCYHI